MSHLSSKIAISGFVVALGVVLMPSDAQAVTVTRQLVGNAVDTCQSALPVFDGQIRKRPLAVQNEGTANAFVTCAFSTTGGIKSATISLGSTAPGPQMVTCTGVAGYAADDVFYAVKSIMLPGGNSNTSLSWTGADYGGGTNLPASPFAISCNLLPDMGVRTTQVFFLEDVGS